jgi:hypothetical protein
METDNGADPSSMLQQESCCHQQSEHMNIVKHFLPVRLRSQPSSTAPIRHGEGQATTSPASFALPATIEDS